MNTQEDKRQQTLEKKYGSASAQACLQAMQVVCNLDYSLTIGELARYLATRIPESEEEAISGKKALIEKLTGKGYKVILEKLTD